MPGCSSSPAAPCHWLCNYVTSIVGSVKLYFRLPFCVGSRAKHGVVAVMRSRSVTCAAHLAFQGEMRNAYIFFAGKSEGKRQLGSCKVGVHENVMLKWNLNRLLRCEPGYSGRILCSLAGFCKQVDGPCVGLGDSFLLGFVLLLWVS